MSQDPRNSLEAIIPQLSMLISEGEKIFEKAGGSTVGDIRKVGEEDHLEKLCLQGGQLWIQSLPFAMAVCRDIRISKKEIRAAYAMDGMVRAGQRGAYEVSESILSGVRKTPEGYYPLEHLKGMLSALRYILAREPMLRSRKT